jgi:RNA polymerase sigma factor (sigma-70 family)
LVIHIPNLFRRIYFFCWIYMRILREFSLEDLPSPLQPSLQQAALKLYADVRKVKRASQERSLEELSQLSGLSVRNLAKIIEKSDRIEQILLESNLRLVHSIALQHQGMGLELDDLVYEGVRGLKKAMSKFDPSKGCAFSTYAYPWIREHIRNALASSMPIALPRSVYRLLVKIRAIQERLSSYGRTPTDEELASEMGISIERFEVVRRAIALAARSSDATPASAEDPKNAPQFFDEATWEKVVEPEREGSVLERVVSKSTPQPQVHNAFLQSEVRAAVIRALETLPQDEARAIYNRLGLGMATDSDVASFFSSSEGDDNSPSTLSVSGNDIDSIASKNVASVLGERSEASSPRSIANVAVAVATSESSSPVQHPDHMDVMKVLFQRGLRRLRRRASDPRYPEVVMLKRLFMESQLPSMLPRTEGAI